MNRVAIIEARMKSSRLPGKVLKPILGKPMLELLIERIRQARRIDQIVVATTDAASDDPIDALTQSLNVGCFRGSEEDVLDRVLQAACRYSADIIVEITGDCPLIEAEKIDQMLSSYQHMKDDFMMNRWTGPIRRVGSSHFRTETLEKVNRLTQDPVDREHVSLYVWEHPDIFSIYHFQNNLDRKYWEIRLTVDNEEDFAFIGAIFSELYPRNPKLIFTTSSILLERKPELMEINRHIQDKPVR